MKRERNYFFLIVWLLMFSGELFPQQKTKNIFQDSLIKPLHLQELAPPVAGVSGNMKAGIGAWGGKNRPVFSVRAQPAAFVSRFSPGLFFSLPGCGYPQDRFIPLHLPDASFYPNSLGVICRTELKMDKLTPVPVRFRLGSLEYVNWMERKPNAGRPF